MVTWDPAKVYLSMRVMLKLCLPFPFSDEARAVAVEKLFNDARALLSAQSAWIRLTLRHNVPTSQCTDQGIVQLTNLLLVCISEYHLTRTIRGCGPIILPKIEGQLRDMSGISYTCFTMMLDFPLLMYEKKTEPTS